MISTLLLLALAAPNPAPAVDVVVVVPLCDGSKLACGKGPAGDPRSLDGNLYWGALYGAERFLGRARGFRVIAKTDAPDPLQPALLRSVVVERPAAAGERTVRLTLLAFDGARIDDALAFFLREVRARRPGLLVWAGHDRLMDVADPDPRSAASSLSSSSSPPANVAVLACVSERFFGPALVARGARAVALTRTFMAPEAYLLEALAHNVAVHGPADRSHLREALLRAYARYQRISTRAAGSVFSQLE